MKDLRAGIIRLLQQGKNSEEIGKLLGISPRTARKVITRFNETGSYEDRPRSGRPITARTPVNKRKIKGRIQRNPSSRTNSTRKMGAALGISKSSAHRILRKDLGMKWIWSQDPIVLRPGGCLHQRRRLSGIFADRSLSMGTKKLRKPPLGVHARPGTIAQGHRDARPDPSQRAGIH